MHSQSRMRLAASYLTLIGALNLGCGRWQPARTYEVASQNDPQVSYRTMLDLVSSEGYTVVSQDEASKQVRIEARVSGKELDRKSFINLQVIGAQVNLSADGYLVHADGKIHKSLSNELASLEGELKERLASGAAAPSSAPTPDAPAAEPAAPSSEVPLAWSEPAYDPTVWGNGNFTCLPVKIPADHQSALTLQLSSGEKADLVLSLAYAPELCRSPAQCKVAGGCPALGIGDTERVNRIAARLSKGEIAGQATLLDGGKPVATIDLARHGSIVQAMTEVKR